MKTALVAALVALAAGPVDLGTVDQKAPTKDDLKRPKSDDGVPKVELKADIKGTAKPDDKRSLYVLVGPVSSKELVGTWWVQGEATRDGAKFAAEAQFGEEAAGAGEYFAVVGVATDRKWSPGDKLTELPTDATYSKVKVVRRVP